MLPGFSNEAPVSSVDINRLASDFPSSRLAGEDRPTRLDQPMMDPARNQPKLEFGCSEKGLRALPLRKQCELLNSQGIAILEIRLQASKGAPSEPSLSSTSTEQIAGLNSLRKEFGIRTPFCSIECQLTTRDAAESKQRLDHVFELLRTAASIGASTINLTVTQIPSIEVDEGIWERFIESLGKLGEEANKHDLRIALITNGQIEDESQSGLFIVETLMTNREALSRLMPLLPSNIGIGYDPGMFKAVNPSDLRLGFDIIQKKIETCVLQDWRQHERCLRRAIIGEDDLDYRTLLQNLPGSTPCLISLPANSNSQPENELKKSKAYIDRILAL